MGRPAPGGDDIIHVVHDVDRDGLGSAAMVCAQLGPDQVRLHPAKAKDVRSLLRELDGPVLVLDIPAPATWDGVDGGLDVTWIDHHLAAWNGAPPDNIRSILPIGDKPTTTMSLLVKHAIVNIPNVLDFVRKLCGEDPEFEWGFAFDTLARTFPRWPLETEDLPGLLAGGPRGERLPDALRSLAEEAVVARDTVRHLLDAAPTRMHDAAVVIELGDTRSIPLAQFSLEVQRRHPGRASILAHRDSLLYCGRASGRRGLDFVRHFRERGLDPRGHPYVVTVRVPRDRIGDEVDALVAALEEETP